MIDAVKSLSNQEEFKSFLIAQGYKEIHFILGDIYVCLSPFLFTWAIIIGQVGDMVGFEDRWCYHNFYDAKSALYKWLRAGCAGEPESWHRNPRSGRRVIDGKIVTYD